MRTSGIYALCNTVTGSVYIGKSTDIEKRLRSHLSALRAGTHKNTRVQHDASVYGLAVFVSKILHSEADLSKLAELEARYIAEQFAQDHLSVYNARAAAKTTTLPTAEAKQNMRAAQCGRVFSDTTKARMRDAWKTREPASVETRAKQSAAGKGKTRSEAFRAHLSAVNMGHEVSAEARRKSSQVQRANMTAERRDAIVARAATRRALRALDPACSPPRPLRPYTAWHPELAPTAKLTAADVAEIQDKYKQGSTAKDLAALYGVTTAVIRRVTLGAAGALTTTANPCACSI